MEPLRPKDPTSIGKYTLVKRLGSGGMGIVYLARLGTDTVALKVVRESLVDDPAQATRFTREIEALRAVDSPFVAKFIDSGVEEDRPWFATEFVDGPNLKTLVSKNGPLDESAWFRLADGLLAGLTAIHQAGVIHRDVKPANIIMAPAGPKLIDFGIAQVADATSVTSDSFVAGSPAWFSPEQIEGRALTSATDFFSAGSVLVFAATGSSPWGDDSTMTKASVLKILTSEPDLAGLTIRQKQLVAGLLSKNPKDRALTVGPGSETSTAGLVGKEKPHNFWKTVASSGSVAGLILLAGATLINFLPHETEEQICSPYANPGEYVSEVSAIEVGSGEPPSAQFSAPIVTEKPELSTVRPGSGLSAEEGSAVDFDVVAYLGSDGQLLTATDFEPGAPVRRVIENGADDYFSNALRCVKPGDRLVILDFVAPVFGEITEDDIVQNDSTVVLVVDVHNVYPARALGTPQRVDSSAPTVSDAPGGGLIVEPPGGGPAESLQVFVLKKGEGPILLNGDKAVTHYTCVHWESETEFSSTYGDIPVNVNLRDRSADPTGDGVAPGVYAGLLGQRVGSQVALVLPPSLGMSDDSTLICVFDILGVE